MGHIAQFYIHLHIFGELTGQMVLEKPPKSAKSY